MKGGAPKQAIRAATLPHSGATHEISLSEKDYAIIRGMKAKITVVSVLSVVTTLSLYADFNTLNR